MQNPLLEIKDVLDYIQTLDIQKKKDWKILKTTLFGISPINMTRIPRIMNILSILSRSIFCMVCVREILWSDIFVTDILALGNLQSHIVHNTQPFTL
jgi:hypothetical protein